jgi:hypothetical protein
MTVDTAAVPENKKNNLSIVCRKKKKIFFLFINKIFQFLDETRSKRCHPAGA